MVFLGVEPRRVGVDFGWRPLRLGGDHFGWRPPWWGGGPCPFSHYALTFALQLRSSPGTACCADLAVVWGTASAGLLDVRSPRVPRWLQSALGRHRCLPSCRNKGFPTSANFESKLSINALMWSAKNGIPKSSWICLLPKYQGALVAMRKHLDWPLTAFGHGCWQRISRSGMRNPSWDGRAPCRTAHRSRRTDHFSSLGGGQTCPIFGLPSSSPGWRVPTRLAAYQESPQDSGRFGSTELALRETALAWAVGRFSRSGKEHGRALLDVDSDPPAPKPKLQSTEVGLQITL
jgi:hypothetical protein